MTLENLTALHVALIMAALAAFALISRKRQNARRPYGQSVEDEKPVPGLKEGQSALSPGKRIAGICFLGVWLFFWTFGVNFALLEWSALRARGEDLVFMTLWLTIAIPGWFFVAWVLFRLMRGDHVEFNFDGDGGD